jgi:hypothetical protein
MNNTKWQELRLAMLDLESPPRWRTRDVVTGFESSWDREWFYHFPEGGYGTIEWVEIAVENPNQLLALQRALAQVHVPGERTDAGFRVYGFVQAGRFVDFVPPPNTSFEVAPDGAPQVDR